MDAQEAIQMWRQGMTIQQIADEMASSPGTIRSLLRSFGIDTHRVRTHPHEQEVVDAYAHDVQVPEILQKYGISYPQLYTILARNDIPVRRKAGAQGRENQLTAAVQMYVEGVAIWKITQDTGVAQPTLHAELHRREIPLRRPRRSGYDEEQA